MSDLDLITVGRVNLDLYAQQPAVEFSDVRGFDAMVGGSPVNVALAGARLGLRTAVLTAVGEDLVGDWVLRSLEREGVDIRFVARKRGPHTSLALRAQLPPDHPLAFYRHNPADIHVTVDDASVLPLDRTRALLVSADALARGSMANACRAVVAVARSHGLDIYLDLDLRDVNWVDLDAYHSTVSAMLQTADVVLGTEAELAAALGLACEPDPGDLLEATRSRLGGDGQVAIIKQGSRGASLMLAGETKSIAGYQVAEASAIGAGDSFAAGLIRARLDGKPWADACEFGAACAAITVSRLGCSAGFPRRDEVAHFRYTHALVRAE